MSGNAPPPSDAALTADLVDAPTSVSPPPSPPPDAGLLLTRAQVCDRFSIDQQVLANLEKQGFVQPTVPGEKNVNRPALFDLATASVAAVTHRAFCLGLRGRALAHLAEAVFKRRHRFSPNWSGVVVFDGTDVDLLAGRAHLEVHATSPPLLVLPLDVPSLDPTPADLSRPEGSR